MRAWVRLGDDVIGHAEDIKLSIRNSSFVINLGRFRHALNFKLVTGNQQGIPNG